MHQDLHHCYPQNGCCTSAGDRLAKVMDGKRTLLHANHGVIVCTETVAEAFDYLYYLEKAAEITVKAMSMGRPLQLIPKPVCEQFHTEMEPPHLVKVFALCCCCPRICCTSYSLSIHKGPSGCAAPLQPARRASNACVLPQHFWSSMHLLVKSTGPLCVQHAYVCAAAHRLMPN